MLPALYHAHHGEVMDDLPFWLDLAGSASRPVLELGCGTGRVLIPLAEAGHAVTGIDHDASMLAFLQSQLPEVLKPRVNLVQADMARFRLACPFPTIIMPCNTLSTLPTATRQATFINIKRHLAEGGVFAASLPNPQALADLPRIGEEEVETTFTHPLSGNPVQVSSAWQRTRQAFVIQWHYDHLHPDGSIERLTVTVSHSLDRLEVYTQEINQAGLKLSSLLGDFDHTSYTPDSPYLILIAQSS